MPCFYCHAAIELPASHSAALLGMRKTWPNRMKRRLGMPVFGVKHANRRTAVRHGRANQKRWRPRSVEEWQARAWQDEMKQWARRERAACWLKDQMIAYYANHEANKARSARNAKDRYYRLKHTPDFRVRHAMRNLTARIARKTKTKKSRRTNEYLGCTIQEARRWIERQFERGMSWANHGEWEIHHIIPLAHWNLSDTVQMLRATHFTNLKPLWREDNRRIGARLVGEHQMALL